MSAIVQQPASAHHTPTLDDARSLKQRLNELLPNRTKLSGMDPQDLSAETIQHRECILADAQRQVCSRLVGLDRQVARIFHLLRPWFLLPKGQRRPTVISLWGMTGVGKTSFVEALVDALDARHNFRKLDIGKLSQFNGVSLDSSSLPNHFEDLSETACILFLDELHTIRTIREDGCEIDRATLADFWTLLDTGILPKSTANLAHLTLQCKRELRAKKENPASDTSTTEEYSLHSIIDALKMRCQPDELRIMVLEHEVEFLEWVIGVSSSIVQNVKPLDFSSSLIFVAGNLDEAFTDSRMLHYEDMDVQELHVRTSEVTAETIKECLLHRFRPEQIARLGSLPIVFPSLSVASFEALIARTLAAIAAWVHATFDLKLTFARSVLELIFREGVVANQGARPTLCTISEMIEGRIATWVIEARRHRAQALDIHFELASHSLVCADASTRAILGSEPMELREHRQPALRLCASTRRIIAVHEAGHALVYISTEGRLPEKVLISASSHHDGTYTTSQHPGIVTKSMGLGWLAVYMGGMAAEQMVFGEEDFSTACGPDVQRATDLAARMITMAGMGEHLGVSEATQPTSLSSFKAQDDKLIEEWLQRARMQARGILKAQRGLFEAVSEQLLLQERLSREDLTTLVSQHYVGSRQELSAILERTQPREFGLPTHTAKMVSH